MFEMISQEMKREKRGKYPRKGLELNDGDPFN